MNINKDKLIEYFISDPDQLLGILELDLKAVSYSDLYCFCTVEWQCQVENVWWPVTAKTLRLTNQCGLRWSETKEAGVDDLEVIYMADTSSLQEWARDIASQLGSNNGNIRDA